MLEPAKYIEIDGEKHKVGDKNCKVGWCECNGYPRECECGGLIHAEYGDEHDDGGYWLYTKCDKCGANDIE